MKVSSEGINAGGNRIQGVADGKEKDDAATVGQLAQVAGSAGQAINELGNHLNRMDNRINRVGAGAAALAASGGNRRPVEPFCRVRQLPEC